MSKSLSVIQTVFKVLRIICKVALILCIVGGVGCGIGLICALFIPFIPNEIIALFSDEIHIGIGDIIIPCLSGLAVCVSEAVLFYFSERYFKNELEAGTPFTYEGSKEIFRLGVLCIAIPFGVSFFVGALQLIGKGLNGTEISTSFSIGRGLVLMLASAIFKYGAEISQGDTDRENEQ